MAPPPAKRQKRNIVLSSDDDEVPTPPSKPKAAKRDSTKRKTKLGNGDGITSHSLPTRPKTKAGTASDPRPPALPPTSQPRLDSSPERPTRKTAKKPLTKSSLHTFFDRKKHGPPKQKESKTENQPHAEEAGEDVIEDDSAEEILYNAKAIDNLELNGAARTLLDWRKPLQEQTLNNTTQSSEEKLVSASQRFLRAGNAAAKDTSQVKVTREAADIRPWAEKYGPTSLEELMVHKKKVADVRGWFEGVLQERFRKRLLILKGPSGAGKTATVSTLAKAMELGLAEWTNPSDTDFSSESYLSMSAQFEDFLGRSGKYGSLTFNQKQTSEPSEQLSQPSGNDSNRLILMEEFPSIFSSTSLALRSFRTSILRYLASNDSSTTSPVSNRPLVMIITESISSASSSDSFTAHRLLGPPILSHPATTLIEFNPVAPTLLLKALELVLQKDARHTGRRRIPGPAVLKHLAETGDIRSAIGSLEFLCLRGGNDEEWSGRMASRSRKSSATAMSKMEQRSLELVSQRERSIGLFHAVGKVVYNKREEPTIANRPTQPPEYLPQHVRLRISEVAVDTLIDEAGTDPRAFIAALHENYVPSCESSSFTDHLNDCIDSLSDADLLTPKYGGRRSFRGNVTEELRQDEISFHVAARGILFALPFPVKRATHPVKGGANKTEAFKMRYPMSMRISRQMEEKRGLVERWSSRAMMAAGDGDSIARRATASDERLILERLPYVAKIERWRHTLIEGSELEEVTTFHGIKALGEEQLSDDEIRAEAIKDRALMPPPAKPRDLLATAPQFDDIVGKLYLSDDDIEDE